MQEEITQKVIRFTTKGVKLTEEALKKAIQLALREMKKRRETPKVGRNNLKRLTGRDGESKKIEIADRLPEFEKYAREYEIRYHIRKSINPDNGKTRWEVFFKSKQEDAMMAAFNKYTKAVIRSKESKKPSILQALRKNLETVRQTATQDRERNRAIGGIER